jgi:NAD(P) transhydrogenase subunit beta
MSSFLYLVCAFSFIMALRGLSSAATSRQGNLYGMFGMAVAILTTLLTPTISRYGIILADCGRWQYWRNYC